MNAKLFQAVEAGNVADVRQLLTKGADPNARNIQQETPVIWAAVLGNTEIFDVLDKAGADLKAKVGDESVFWRAGICSHGDDAAALRILRRIIEAVGIEGDRLDCLLTCCVDERGSDYIRGLLKLGANPNWQDEGSEDTALAIAVWHKRTDNVRELLAAGANPNALMPKAAELDWTEGIPRKFWKKPIIDFAISKKLDEIVQLLRDAGARETAPETPAASPADDIATSWKRIESWIKANARGWKPLKKGATNERIEKAATTLGTRLPDDWKSFYRIHNGSDDLVPAPGCSYFLTPLAEVVQDWKMMGELLDDGNFQDSDAKPDKGIRKVWWSKGWIPFASDGGGDYYCIDLDPGKGGTNGQVIAFKHETGERSLLAASLRK